MTARFNYAYSVLLAAVCGGLFYPHNATAAPQEIEDLLEARWYEIEMIVFERLNVLDVNSTETLTSTRPRSWPANLMEIRENLPEAANPDETAQVEPSGEDDNPLLVPSPYCLGYPMWEEEDPLHPLLQPPDEFQFSDDILPRKEDLADDGVSEDLPEEYTAVPDIDPEAESDSTLTATPPPLNAPDIKLTPYLQLLADVADFEQSLYASSYTWLPDLTMGNDVKAINRQPHLRPVLHRRWRAPIPPRDAPQPIYIASAVDADAPLTLEGFAKIEGYITVTVGRYLHFAPTLWYHADNLGMAPVALPNAVDIPLPVPGRYMELKQSRRMRSGDLHYLDHPKFGVIVRIDPVAVPESLTEALKNLEGADNLSQ